MKRSSHFLAAAALTMSLVGPGLAQTEPNVADLLANVTSLQGTLQSTVSNLESSIEDSANSQELGTQLLDEMLAAAKDLEGSLGREGKIWVDLNTLLDTWRGKRDDLLERAKTNSDLRPVADTWQARIDEAMALRSKILDQAAESSVLAEQIANRREVVLAYYEADAAEKVLKNMRQMSSQLTSMNSAMTAILEQTGVVAGEDNTVSNN